MDIRALLMRLSGNVEDRRGEVLERPLSYARQGQTPGILAGPLGTDVTARRTPKTPGSPITYESLPEVVALRELAKQPMAEPFQDPMDEQTASLQRYLLSLKKPEFSKEQIEDAYKRWPKEIR